MKMTSSKQLRTCVVTRVSLKKDQLIKITRVRGVWMVDVEQKLDGRSIYLTRDKKALIRFKKQQKRFKIDDLQWNDIIGQLEELIDK